MRVKGALCSSEEEIQTQNLNIYNINEVMEQTIFRIWMNKLFSEENRVRLFYSVYTIVKTESLFICQSAHGDLSLLIEMKCIFYKIMKSHDNNVSN